MNARKRLLISDILRLWKQGVAIVGLLACGIATFIMSTSTIRSMEASRDQYYAHYHFAHAWASLVRAPNALLDRILEIPGVTRASGRIVRQAILDFPNLSEPVTARLVSIETKSLDALYLRKGRLPKLGAETEVVVSELFAEAHDLKLGDTLQANLGGKRDLLHIVGIGLSPDSIYVVQPGLLLSDNRLYGIVWAPREKLEAVWNMDGAFNHLAVELENPADGHKIQTQIDELLSNYGGTGSILRDDQESHARIRDELNELRTMAFLAPAIFLSVTIFLLHMVFSRWIGQQRERIATLRAFGYRVHEIAWHVLQVISIWIGAGVILGVLIGLRFANALSGIYKDFFRFPEIIQVPFGWEWIGAVMLGAAVAALGAWSGLKQVVRLPPALAMQAGNLQPSAARFLALWSLRSTSVAKMSPILRLVLLRMLANPKLTLLSILGLSLGISLLILSSFFQSTIDRVLEHQFSQCQRHDFQLTFDESKNESSMYEISQWPGVTRVEGFRAVPVQLHNGNQRERLTILGLDPNAELFRLLDTSNQASIPKPNGGLVITKKLADKLGVSQGDFVEVEVLEGVHRRQRLPIDRIFANYTGPSVSIDRATLHEWMREGDRLSGVFLTLDPNYRDEVYQRIKKTPVVCGVLNRQATLANFRELLSRSTSAMRFINAIFAALITLGVAYNSALITFSERARDLATLRVLGYRQNEILWILLLELILITLLAIPIGIPLGYTFAYGMITALDTDSHRLPMVFAPSIIAYTLSVIAAATALCCLMVAQMASKLEIIHVLKVRE